MPPGPSQHPKPKSGQITCNCVSVKTHDVVIPGRVQGLSGGLRASRSHPAPLPSGRLPALSVHQHPLDIGTILELLMFTEGGNARRGCSHRCCAAGVQVCSESGPCSFSPVAARCESLCLPCRKAQMAKSLYPFDKETRDMS